MTETQAEIKAAIAFYEKRGWDWLSVVAFMSSRAVGTWPPHYVKTRIGVGIGRPREKGTTWQ
jgi:hypothetical protein